MSSQVLLPIGYAIEGVQALLAWLAFPYRGRAWPCPSQIEVFVDAHQAEDEPRLFLNIPPI